MKISAVIPAYNNAQFLKEAIDSILKQTHPIDEIIIVDDGSTDQTQQIADSFGDQITYIKQQNQGPSAARNNGILAAKGSWIAFLDADDQWTPHKIERQLSALKSEPALKLIAADMAEVNQAGDLWFKSVLAKHNQLEQFRALNGKPLPNALASLATKNFIPTGTVFVERAVLIEAECFNPQIRFGEDLELWAKIACNHPITCLPEVMMLRRQHSNNATQNSEAMLKDLVKVMQSVKKWGSDKLKEQNRDANQLVASALCDLGYWYFSQDNHQEALKHFLKSLKESPSKRALIYTIICCVPSGLINMIRKIKNR
jgi:glycosyltransferase involved in cell wall biosynthesis